MISFLSFNCFILFFVVIDFWIVSRNQSAKTYTMLTIFWIVVGLLFSAYVYYYSRSLELFYEYLSAYFIEKSLSLDNIFVFLLIFSKFNIDFKYQHKVLFLGIWGALFFRYIMIFVLGELIDKFHFLIPVFGLFLLYTGITSLKKQNTSIVDMKYLKKFSNHVELNHEGNFFVKQNNGSWKMTILILVLILVEISDVVFAFDSIPAIFSITSHKDIVYTSNAFAIIGLRSLYGIFSEIINRLYYLKHAVSIILCAIGIKMIFADVIHIGSLESLMFIVVVLLGSYGASVIKEKKGKI